MSMPIQKALKLPATMPERIVSEATAFAGGGDDFVHVLGVGAGKDLGEFGNEHGGQRAATDDRGQLPPQVGMHWVSHSH